MWQVGRGSLIQAPLDDDAGRIMWVCNLGHSSLFEISSSIENHRIQNIFWTSSCRITKSLCESQTCPMDLITPPDDCHVNYTLSFSIQVSEKESFSFSIQMIVIIWACLYGIVKYICYAISWEISSKVCRSLPISHTKFLRQLDPDVAYSRVWPKIKIVSLPPTHSLSLSHFIFSFFLGCFFYYFVWSCEYYH